ALATKRWQEIRASQVGKNSPPSKGTKPSSVRDTAKALGIDPKEVRNRNKIAAMVPEAADVLANMPDRMKPTQADFLHVASHPRSVQVRAAKELIAKKQEWHEKKKAQKKAVKPKVRDDEGFDSPEDIWSRGLSNRAEEAAELALYEDWSKFKVNSQHVA